MTRGVLLRGSMLWDGQQRVRAGADVLVDNGPVVAVGDTAGVRDVRVIDLEGRHVVPGLIDMHVHLVWAGSPDPATVVEREGEQLTTVQAAAHAQLQVRAGITTVRDLGGNAELPLAAAAAVDRGAIEGPTIVAAGQTIIITGGHDPFGGWPATASTPLSARCAARSASEPA